MYRMINTKNKLSSVSVFFDIMAFSFTVVWASADWSSLPDHSVVGHHGQFTAGELESWVFWHSYRNNHLALCM